MSKWYNGNHKYIKYIKCPGAKYPPDNVITINLDQENISISKGSVCPVGGSISSTFPGIRVTASLDGSQYADINVNGAYLDIGSSSINKSFKGATLSEGHHTIKIVARNSLGTTAEKDVSIEVVDNRPTYRFDLNGFLDGYDYAWLVSDRQYGTADVYLNDEKVADDAPDFWGDFPAGTTYRIDDIKALDGYVYRGAKSGSAPLSGTINGDATVILSFDTALRVLNNFDFKEPV